jgi:hypothetical protein
MERRPFLFRPANERGQILKDLLDQSLLLRSERRFALLAEQQRRNLKADALSVKQPRLGGQERRPLVSASLQYILKNNVVVGQYAITRRVTFGGTDVQNTAMTTVTLFFTNASTPPHNVTLQGAHSFSSGRFTGSVSAASNRYTWIHDADASISTTSTIGTNSLSISWAGANQLTLP